MNIVIKKLDSQGRVVIPKKWREKYLKNRKVIMKIKGDLIEIIPLKVPDLTKYFDIIEVRIESDLANWHEVRRELRKW